MKQQQLFLLVLTGVVLLVPSVPCQLFLIQQSKTWTDAQAYCQSKYTDLATIKSSEDMIQLQTEAQNQQFSSSAWIGLYNFINSFRWSLGNEPLGSTTFWFLGEPNSRYENCVAISKEGWYDEPCTYSYGFICFDDFYIAD